MQPKFSIFGPLVAAALLISPAAGAQAPTPLDQSANADAHFNLGLARMQRGDHERAIENFNAAIKINPRDDRAYHMRCRARALIGRELRHALADCNEVLRLNPHNVRVFDARGFAHLRLGEFRRSVGDYDTMLRFEPAFAASLYGRGLGKRALGDLAGAQADIAAASAIAPDIAARFARYGVR